MRVFFITMMFLMVSCYACVLAKSAPVDNQASIAMSKDQLNNELNKRYTAWITWINNHPESNDLTGCDEFKSIIDLGPRALPLIVGMLRDKSTFPMLAEAIPQIAKIRIPIEKWPKDKLGDANSAGGVYMEWWNVDRKDINETYANLKAKWKELLNSDKVERGDFGQPLLWVDQDVYEPGLGIVHAITRRHITDLGKIYLSVNDLGIDVLPLILNDMKNDDYDFMSIFMNMTHCNQGTEWTTPKERTKLIVAWWNIHKDEWTIPEE